MLQYLAKCLLTRRKPQYKLLYKWLTLFQDTTQWQESIRKKEGHTIFITFKITIFQIRKDNDIQIQRRYDTQVLSGNHFHKRTSQLADLNGVKESSISKESFCSLTADWHHTYPQKFVHEIRKTLHGFHSQYSKPINDYDHPRYRVEGHPREIKKYIPGLKIYVNEYLSGSEESDSGDSNNSV
ncbi:hypothetical protein KSS87_018837 [Heliosperma pusillum]|nr:hypothetical protein KSS87_018837 [Heliosperma pusillum]